MSRVKDNRLSTAWALIKRVLGEDAFYRLRGSFLPSITIPTNPLKPKQQKILTKEGFEIQTHNIRIVGAKPWYTIYPPKCRKH
jgi:hypothetical protein